MNETDQILIGVDAGGTKTQILVHRDVPEAPSPFEGGGINLKRDGISSAAEKLATLIKEAINDCSATASLHLCAGIAGAGRSQDREALQQQLSSLLEPRPLLTSLCTDADIAYYAAHKNNPGVLIIAGTGSIILAKNEDGEFLRAGGWGYKLGDEAAGYQLGRAGLAAVADHMDGGPQTLLTSLIKHALEIANANELISHTYNPATRIQSIAPLVLEAAQQGDQMAQLILDDQLSRLAKRLQWMLDKHAGIATCVCIFGGLSKNAFYLERLKSILQHTAPDITFTSMSMTPVEAALHLAAQLKESPTA